MNLTINNIPIYRKGRNIRKGSAAVRRYQQQLRNAGFNIKVDGIWGKQTQAAHEQYTNNNKKRNNTTPISRNNTTTTNKRTTNWRPEISAGGNCGTENCSRWANESLRNFKDNKNRILYRYADIGGDAWTRLYSGENPKIIFSGYKDDGTNKGAYSEAKSNQRNWEAADNFYKNFNSKTLDKNKVYLVNMYYNGSRKKREAWDNALNGTTGTHTGNVYWNPETNSWKVAHNVHGTLHDDDFISVQGSRNKYGYGITAIAEAPRVDYTRRDWNEEHPIKASINNIVDSIFGKDLGMWKQGGVLKAQGGITVTAINPNKNDGDSNTKKFITALNDNRGGLMQKFGLTDQEYADLSKFAVNIAQRESQLGHSVLYKAKKWIPDAVMDFGKKFGRGRPSPPSRGITQIKYQADIQNPEYKKVYDQLGISDHKLQYDYDTMAKATIARAVLNAKHLGNNTYHYSDGTEIPQEEAWAIYWNRGKLTDNINQPPSNLEADGPAGYIRRYNNQKVVK